MPDTYIEAHGSFEDHYSETVLSNVRGILKAAPWLYKWRSDSKYRVIELYVDARQLVHSYKNECDS